MRGYLLDTDICISLLQGKYHIQQKIEEVGIENCAISEITLLELQYGAEKSTRKMLHLAEVGKMRSLFQVLLISSCFSDFASQKVRLQRAGALIPAFDLLIGCTALATGLTVVTGNTRHLMRISDLQVENWRLSTFNQFIP